MKKSILASLNFVGTIIGAGFASGKEIGLYFGGCSFVTPLLSSLLIALYAYFFCEIGRVYHSPEVLLKHGTKLYSLFIKGANAIIFCTTIAGSEEVLFLLTGFHGGAVFTAFITLFSFLIGKKVSDILSSLSVLVIVCMVVFLFFLSRETTSLQGKFSPLSAILYATMNMLSGGFFLSTLSKDFSRKDSFITAALSFIVLSLLLLCVFFLTKNYYAEMLPLIPVAEKNKIGKIGSIIIYLAMFTTCTGTCIVTCGKSFNKKIVLTIIALLVSSFGFNNLIGSLYPIIGIIGCIICSITILLYFIKKPKSASPLNSDAPKMILR